MGYQFAEVDGRWLIADGFQIWLRSPFIHQPSTFNYQPIRISDGVVSGLFVGARLCQQDQPQRLSVWDAFGPPECCGWCAWHTATLRKQMQPASGLWMI